MKTVNTRTGKIFTDVERKLEFLWVGDYTQAKNIKADFLGFEEKIEKVEHGEVDLSEKIVITISTQKGCPMNCKFCDVPMVKLDGNASVEDMLYQIKYALSDIVESKKVYHTKRLNIHFARMGEPAFNNNVLETIKLLKNEVLNENFTFDTIHPVYTTMLPRNYVSRKLSDSIIEFCNIKNEIYDGEAGLQFSINDTNEEKRDYLFDNKSLSLKTISELSKLLPNPKGRKYTLNFAVDKNSEIDPKTMDSLFDKDKFIIKITPIHETKTAIKNEYGIIKNSYDVYEKFEKPLTKAGWDVLVFIPSLEEDEDRITCGNLLLKYEV